MCAGENYYGQCAVTKDVATSVAAGWNHTCVLRGDGTINVYGANDVGQCEVPSDLGPVISVAAGGNHTCALQADGKVVCFGANNFGQCPSGKGISFVVARGNHTCVLTVDGQLRCFGGSQSDGPSTGRCTRSWRRAPGDDKLCMIRSGVAV